MGHWNLLISLKFFCSDTVSLNSLTECGQFIVLRTFLQSYFTHSPVELLVPLLGWTQQLRRSWQASLFPNYAIAALWRNLRLRGHGQGIALDKFAPTGFYGAMNSYLEKHDPAKNLARFYSLTILPNLFGEWSLQREWGRIGRNGQIRIAFFPSHSQALQAFHRIKVSKTRRGYQVIPEQLSMF